MSLLFEPLTIGTFQVPNRLMQTAHSKQYSDRVESDRETAYFMRRAKGGCGLFVAGNQFVHPTGSIRNFEDAWRPEAVEADRRMTDAIHEAGARIVVQLNHHGAQAQPDGPDGPRPVFAPSRLISPSTGHATKAATRTDIAGFVEGWARSAELAREGGFDGVEIHLAHGYLLHQFLSPLYNAREDEYGGDLEGRTRFPREVLRAVRERVGEDFTVGIRIVANDHHPAPADGAGPAGLTAADCREIVARLRADARIDFLDLAAGGYHDVHWVFPSSPMPVDWLREDTAAMKAANPDVPVFGVGSARSVEEAAEVVDSGIADMVALTRAQLADPDLAVKLRDGRTNEIRHCIRLNQGCLGRGSRGLPVSCTVNPLAGRELDRGPRPAAAVARRWAVVGGGPAGMRAAVELAADGHRVTLFEAAERLGGQLLLARRVPGRESIGLLVDDLVRDVAAAGVEVRLGERATATDLVGFDDIVVATGAVAPQRTSLAFGGGWEGGVPDGVVDAFTAFADPSRLGERPVVVDGDGTAYAAGVVLRLLEEAQWLSHATPFETVFPHIGAGYDRPLLLERLTARGRYRPHTSLVATGLGAEDAVRIEFPPGHPDATPIDTARTGSAPLAIRFRGMFRGGTHSISGITAVVAIEPRQSVAVDGLESGAASLGEAPVRWIGDAVSPRGIDAAIAEAVDLAYDLAALPAAG